MGSMSSTQPGVFSFSSSPTSSLEMMGRLPDMYSYGVGGAVHDGCVVRRCCHRCEPPLWPGATSATCVAFATCPASADLVGRNVGVAGALW